MSHESMSLDEEKRLMKEMKQLEGTRARVIAHEASRAKFDNDTEKDVIQGKVKVCLPSLLLLCKLYHPKVLHMPLMKLRALPFPN